MACCIMKPDRVTAGADAGPEVHMEKLACGFAVTVLEQLDIRCVQQWNTVSDQ